MPFQSTGSWTTWAPKNLNVALHPGSNTIRVDPATATGLPNVDHLDVN